MTSTFWRGDLHSGVDRTIKLSRSDRPLTDPKTVHRTVLCTLTMTAGAPRLDITATNVDSPSQIEWESSAADDTHLTVDQIIQLKCKDRRRRHAFKLDPRVREKKESIGWRSFPRKCPCKCFPASLEKYWLYSTARKELMAREWEKVMGSDSGYILNM